MNIIDKLAKKGSDKEKTAREVIQHPEWIPQLLEGLTHARASVRFGCEKILRMVSEQRPDLIYPHFHVFEKMLDQDNSFLKWGAIITIANLAAVDAENKIEGIFDKYYSSVTGKTMVTAANTIAHSWKIARAKPGLAEKISRAILKSEKARYEYYGQFSPECVNVVCGHAIDSLSRFYDLIENKKDVENFVRRQLKNARKPVAKKAEKFLMDYPAVPPRRDGVSQ
jgi:hypothetical protein